MTNASLLSFFIRKTKKPDDLRWQRRINESTGILRFTRFLSHTQLKQALSFVQWSGIIKNIIGIIALSILYIALFRQNTGIWTYAFAFEDHGNTHTHRRQRAVVSYRKKSWLKWKYARKRLISSNIIAEYIFTESILSKRFHAQIKIRRSTLQSFIVWIFAPFQYFREYWRRHLYYSFFVSIYRERKDLKMKRRRWCCQNN